MKKTLGLLLAFFLLMTMLLPVFSFDTIAAPNHETKRTIAIVFDNSGSMYQGNDDTKKAWCRATYAMESFATMMNASDTMVIYPMHPIEANDKKYDSKNPLYITQQNSSVIRDIYTPNPLGTPIETINDAYNGLSSASADEKWLIVLTDGAAFYENGKELSVKNTISKLETVLSSCLKTVNVMYLGIGKDAAIPQNVNGSNRYVWRKATKSSEILENLTYMCNMIFGRNTLKAGAGSETIDFDVSLSKLILFIQGENISNITLENCTATDTDLLKFSEKGAGGKPFLVDRTLQGVMITFGNVEAGSYPLHYTGSATSVVAYYEPEVDLKTTAKDENGKTVDPENPTAGKYFFESSLVDKNGKATTSSLLGNPIYSMTYTLNGETKTVNSSNGKFEVELDHKDSFDADFSVTYLDGYNITRSAEFLFGWPSFGLNIAPLPAGKLTMSVTGEKDRYDLADFENGAVYRLDFFYEGTKLEGSQLDRTDVSAKLDGGNALYEVKRDDAGYYVHVTVNGTPLNTTAARYKLTVTGKYTNEDGLDTNTVSDNVRFELEDNSGKLKMELDVPQNYYQLSELKNGKPITVKLTLNGAPLTNEQLNQVNLTCNSGGLKLITEPLADQSAFKVTIDPESNTGTGSYRLSFSATAKNEIGRDVSASRSTSVQIRILPQWLLTLIILLIIALIILLIYLYLTAKVLPKRINLTNTVFNVDGEAITGNANLTFNEGGKKRGSVSIKSPKCFNGRAVAGLKLDVEAVSPRYMKSNQRKMRVTGVKVTDEKNVISYKVGSTNFNKDPLTGKFRAAGKNGDKFTPFEIGNNAQISIFKEGDDLPTVNFQTKINLPKK